MTSKMRRRPASALAELREEVRIEGARAAYRALVEICNDPKASSQARATASTTLFRAAGMLERVEDDLDDLEPGEMTHDQLMRFIAQNAREAGAPGELVDAVEQGENAGPAEPEQSVEVAPPRRGRRAAAEAGKPVTVAGSPLDVFG